MKSLRTVIGIAIAIAIVPARARAQAPSAADLQRSIGSKKDGWSPVIVRGLRGQMTPEQVAKYFPGADRVPDTGMVEIPVEGKPGLDRLKFWFQNDRRAMKPSRLSSVTLIFDAKLTDVPAFYDTLWRVCERKFGKIKKREKIEKKFITWVSPSFRIAQLSKFPGRDGDAFHLALYYEPSQPPTAPGTAGGPKRR